MLAMATSQAVRAIAVIACLGPGAPNVPATDQIQDTKISVRLTVSSETYDPAEPAGVLQVEITNNSSEEITIPGGYDGQTLVLYGQGENHRWASRLWSRRDKGQLTEKHGTVKLKPGERQTVFEQTLAELLSVADDGDHGWQWDWVARPAPPRSPIHSYRAAGYEDVATFWAELRIDGRDYKTSKASLSIVKDAIQDGAIRMVGPNLD